VKRTGIILALVILFGQVMANDSEPLPPRDDSRWSSAQKDIQTFVHQVPTELGLMNVEIHLPKQSPLQASFIAQILSLDAPKLVEYFGWLPKGIVHLHLDTEQKSANGFASVFPHNHIGLHAMPPLGDESLTIHSQYMRALIVHELIHIIHMDQTRGLLAAIRSVFGSVGKLGGVVPRWFSEGVATWGETEFTSGGRLHHRLLDQELLRALSRPDFCQTIDCLDNPGLYPYGHVSYWLGSRFLHSLEQKKSGTIACIVRENSKRLPFFLNTAFKYCTGSSVHLLFSNFRQHYLAQKNRPEPRLESQSLNLTTHTPLYQYGVALTQNFLARAIRERHRSSLEVTTLSSGAQEKMKGIRGRLTSIQTPSSYGKKKDRVLIRQSKNLRDQGQLWSALHLPTKKLESISLPHDVDYLFERGENQFLLWRFHQGRFELASFTTGDQQSTPLLRLDPRETMRSPRLVSWAGEEQMIFSSQWQDDQGLEVYSLKSISPGKRPKLLYLSRDKFEVLDMADDVIILFSKGEFVSLGSEAKTMPISWSENLASLRLRGGSSSQAFVSFVYGKDKDFVLNLKSGPMGALASIQTIEQDLSMLDSPKPLESRSYPGLRHFRPYYWAFGIGGSDQLTRYDVTSSLSDPLNRHRFELMGSYYQEIKEPGGVASYTYGPGAFGVNLSAMKSFTIRGARLSADEQTTQSAMLFYRKRAGRFSFLPSLYVHLEDIDDFISSRKQTIYGFNQGLSYVPLFSHSFFGPATLSFSLFRQTTEGFESFLGERAKIDLSLRSGWEPLEFQLMGSYGRLRKTGLINGLLFGGGSAALYNLGGYHEFYGVEYGDIFGNQITTMRGQANLRLFESYRGPGLFPLFLKSTHVLAGVDYAKSQVIFLGRNRVNAREIKSYFAGLRFKTDFSYFIPVDADLIYAQVQNPKGENQSQVLFLLRGSFDFRSL
jgi:hypothetical protein